MSFSDLFLLIFILAVMACILWVIDINPYSKQLQVYNQSCEDMILDNSYCNGEWIDDPVVSYFINREQSTVTSTDEQGNTTTYNNCSISDRKNWSCTNSEADESISAVDGIVSIKKDTDDVSSIGKRPITRLKWLQNRFLEKFNTN